MGTYSRVQIAQSFAQVGQLGRRDQIIVQVLNHNAGEFNVLDVLS